MNPDFEQAIDMTRAGDKVGAQKKVAAILKEDPNNAHAWYLLSLLVDSDQKRAVYLSKVMALDPNHEKAMEQLAMLEATATPPPHLIQASTDEDLFDQAEAGTVPDWMDDFETAVTETAVIEDDEEPTETETVPDWVQEDLSHSWADEEDSMAASTVAAPPAAKTTHETKTTPSAKKKSPDKKKATSKKKQAQQLNLILFVLVIVTILVAIALIYTLIG